MASAAAGSDSALFLLFLLFPLVVVGAMLSWRWYSQSNRNLDQLKMTLEYDEHSIDIGGEILACPSAAVPLSPGSINAQPAK